MGKKCKTRRLPRVIVFLIEIKIDTFESKRTTRRRSLRRFKVWRGNPIRYYQFATGVSPWDNQIVSRNIPSVAWAIAATTFNAVSFSVCADQQSTK